MELPVPVQLRELGWALVTGLALGWWYDLLRPLRRGPWTTGLTDGLYSLTVLLTLLSFTLYPGRGHLRIFALLAMAAAGALHLARISPLLVRVQGRLGLLPGKGGRRGRGTPSKAAKSGKIFQKNEKN